MSASPATMAITDLAEVNPLLSVSRPRPFERVSFIPMADVSDSGEWVNRQSRRLADIGAGYTPFQEHDVLFAKITPCMENGKGTLAVGLEHGIGFGSTEFHVLRARPGNEPRFMYHVSRWEMLRRKAESMMIGSAGQQRVATEFFAQFRIARLTGDHQRRIADILDAVDAAIRQTEAVIAKLRQMKAGLLYYLLSRLLESPEKTINDIAIHVGSGATPTGGSEVYKTEGVLFLRSQNVTFEGLKLDDVAHIDLRTHRAMARIEVFPHDVLLNITGASIGRCCPLPDGLGPANVNQHVCAIRIMHATRADAVYLAAVLRSPIGQSQIDRLNAGGNREGLNYQNIRSFTVPWPAADERSQNAATLEAADARIRAEEAYCAKLKLQKRGLMHDLLTGRVRV